MDGQVKLMQGDARHLDLPDNSVDLIVTSPPYFGLRSYQDGGEHYKGQVGDEATPAEFIDALIECTREMMRVTKPTGSIWVNLGDKYSQRVALRQSSHQDGLQPGRPGVRKDWKASKERGEARMPYQNITNPETGSYVPEKSLMGIPWRYAIRCIDELGLILRAEVIWSKPNGLPESVKDRVRRSHEQWFCFQQDQSGSVVQGAEPLPFCKVCSLPVDARATLVARLKEVDCVVKPGRVPDEVRADAGVQLEDAGGCHRDVAVSPRSTSVPPLEERHAEVVEGASDLHQDGLTAVVDGDSEDGSASSSDEGDRALSVDDSGQPSGVAVCQCESHAVIVDDEPWIPQSLAAELMQSVADGETDPQHVADFLSGDYARTHSTWFHFTLKPRYYSSVDAIREPHKSSPGREGVGALGGQKTIRPVGPNSGAYNIAGKLPGSVRTVATEPLRVPDELGVDHYAAFPTAWPRWIIQGWSPENGVILDPFGGTGTTALVASVLGRTGISNDMSSDYTRIAQWRTTDPKQRAKAAGLKYKQPPKMRAEKPLFETEEEDSCRG